MAEKHVHKVYGSFPPWGKSVEFPAGGGGGNYVYYSGGLNDFGMYGMFASTWKVNDNSATAFLTTGLASLFEPENIMGVGFDLSMKMTDRSSGELVTVGEAIAEPSKNWTQITEEEFYKIVPKFAIIHHGGGENVTIHEYEEGMTWGEWVNSDYNTINALISDNNQVQILIPNNDWNATLGSNIDGWLYSDNIIKSEQYDAHY